MDEHGDVVFQEVFQSGRERGSGQARLIEVVVGIVDGPCVIHEIGQPKPCIALSQPVTKIYQCQGYIIVYINPTDTKS